MAVQVATSGRLAASPARTSIDHRRGSIISAKVLCGGVTTVSGVATMSTSALDSSAMDVFGDMRLPAGALGVPTVFSSEAIVVRGLCVCEAVRRDGIDSGSFEVRKSLMQMALFACVTGDVPENSRNGKFRCLAVSFPLFPRCDSPVDRLQEDQSDADALAGWLNE